MTPDDINSWAETLHNARTATAPIEQISDKIKDFERLTLTRFKKKVWHLESKLERSHWFKNGTDV